MAMPLVVDVLRIVWGTADMTVKWTDMPQLGAARTNEQVDEVVALEGKRTFRRQ